MDERQNSIIAQTCIKVAGEAWARGEVSLGDVLEAATAFEEWVHAADSRWPSQAPQNGSTGSTVPTEAVRGCPKCGSEMWDNTAPGKKLSPKSPDFKCKNKACGHAIWLTPRAWSNTKTPAGAPDERPPF